MFSNTDPKFGSAVDNNTQPHYEAVLVFITEIYIAPLQDYYSEVLPTPAQINRTVSRLK